MVFKKYKNNKPKALFAESNKQTNRSAQQQSQLHTLKYRKKQQKIQHISLKNTLTHGDN